MNFFAFPSSLPLSPDDAKWGRVSGGGRRGCRRVGFSQGGRKTHSMDPRRGKSPCEVDSNEGRADGQIERRTGVYVKSEGVLKCERNNNEGRVTSNRHSKAQDRATPGSREGPARRGDLRVILTAQITTSALAGEHRQRSVDHQIGHKRALPRVQPATVAARQSSDRRPAHNRVHQQN